MKTFSLNGTWRLRGQNEVSKSDAVSLDAIVPGCVQLDLSRNGLLPEDLFLGMNIRETEKYEEYEWWYERKFEIDEPKKHTFLVFRGVDCIAEYFLNGEKIGEQINAPYDFYFDKNFLGEAKLTVLQKTSIAPVFGNTKYWDENSQSVAWRGTPSTEKPFVGFEKLYFIK